MFAKSLDIKLAAIVVLTLAMIHVAAEAGESPVATGVVVAKGNNNEMITLQDEDGTRLMYSARGPVPTPRGVRWKLDEHVVDAIAQTPLRSTVKVAWQGDRRTLVQLVVLAPPAPKPSSSEGTFVGILTDKGRKYIIVKGGDGDPLKFIAHSMGAGRDASPDVDMLKAIGNRKPNDRVFVKWDLEKDNQALVELRLAKNGEKTTYPVRDANKAATSAPAPVSTEGGVVVGRVDDKDVGIAIKVEDKIQHYVPRMIAAEGDKPAHLDPDIIKAIAAIHMDATVQITWLQDGKIRRITAIKTVPRGTTQPVDDSGKPLTAESAKTSGGNDAVVKTADSFKEGDEGTLAGTVTDHDSGFVTILTDEDTPRKLKFTPQWIGGSTDQGGGLDQAMQKKMANLKPGQKVQIKWTFQERLRAVTITVNGGASDKPAAVEPKAGEKGTYTGTLVGKDDTSITVKTDGENPLKLKFIPKGEGKDMLATFRAINVGAKVQVQWECDEHLQVTRLTKINAE